jgi:hypothetical protein
LFLIKKIKIFFFDILQGDSIESVTGRNKIEFSVKKLVAQRGFELRTRGL